MILDTVVTTVSNEKDTEKSYVSETSLMANTHLNGIAEGIRTDVR